MEPSPWRSPAGVGLRDAHLHLYQYARSLTMVDFSACASGGEMLDLVADACRWHEGEVIIADKARPEAWAGGWPTLESLDRAAGGTLFCGWCFDYHALIANSAALAHAGIGPGTPNPEHGVIGRDRDGSLTGVLYESAATRLWECLPDTDRDHAGELIARAIDRLRGHGIVDVHDLKAQSWLGPVLASLESHGVLDGFSITLWPLLEDLGAVLESRAAWESDRVRLGGAKVFVDGTLNSRTAWMLDDYADAGAVGRPDRPRGLAMMTPAQICAAVRRCDGAGVPLAAHAIGDAAVRAVLDAVEAERPRTPGFRIEHAELVHPGDVPRFADLGVICSVQPCHLLYDIEALRRGVPDRLDRVLPLRSLIDAGCDPGGLLVFGSDAPIVRPDPGDSIQAAVERRRVGLDEDDAVGIEQAITPDVAWRCFTARSTL